MSATRPFTGETCIYAGYDPHSRAVSTFIGVNRHLLQLTQYRQFFTARRWASAVQAMAPWAPLNPALSLGPSAVAELLVTSIGTNDLRLSKCSTGSLLSHAGKTWCQQYDYRRCVHMLPVHDAQANASRPANHAWLAVCVVVAFRRQNMTAANLVRTSIYLSWIIHLFSVSVCLSARMYKRYCRICAYTQCVIWYWMSTSCFSEITQYFTKSSVEVPALNQFSRKNSTNKVRQNCVQLPTPVDNMTLLAFAAVGPATQQSIDISSNCSSWTPVCDLNFLNSSVNVPTGIKYTRWELSDLVSLQCLANQLTKSRSCRWRV